MKYVKELSIIFLGLMFFYTFLIQNYKIPSSSMEITLNVGDQVLVNKMVYGWSIPRMPILNIPIIKDDFDRKLTYLNTLRNNVMKNLGLEEYMIRKPKKGEIIAFENPENTNDLYVKRVVAEEGDIFFLNKEGFWLKTKDKISNERETKIIKNEVFVRNQILNNNKVEDNGNRKLKIFKIKKVEGLKLIEMNGLLLYKVKKDYVFVLGDNRNNSKDSRYIGAIHKKHIIGKIFYRFLEIKSDSIGVSNNRFF